MRSRPTRPSAAPVVLITGGASGIGAALARVHAAAGATVVVADLVPQDPSHVLLDVTDREAFHTVAQQVVAEHGRIDVFHNNAGIGVGGLFEELGPEHWDRAIDINLRGVVHGVEAVYPVMCDQRDGHIVNTASLAGLLPAPVMAPYTVTKHAVVALSQVLRSEARAHGVRVTALCPAFVETPLLDNLNPGMASTRVNGRARQMIRRMGPLLSADDLAALTVRRLAQNPEVITAPRIVGGGSALAARLAPGVVRLVCERVIRGYRRSA